ncbi:hypothetical protein ACMC9I_11070 [Deinococcota bacterium DY0809b]
MTQKLKYALLGFLVAALGLWGRAVTIPNTFQSGDVASAAEMNQNFTALKNAVDTLEAKVAALETAKADLESKLAAVTAGSLALPSRDGALGYYQALTGGAPMAGADYFNSSGGAIDYAFDNTSYEYTITFEDLGRGTAASGSPGVALVSPMGAQVYKRACKATVNDSATNAIITVYCYDLDTGDPTPSTFSLLYVR